MDKKRLIDSQKNAFWTALILTIFVFAGGILLGFMLENSRTSKIEMLYLSSELELADMRIQQDILSFPGFNCTEAIAENTAFADNVYEQAKTLEKYDDASEISDAVKIQHKKYDLLRTLFWVNSINLKQKCSAQYHNIVYLYDYNEPRLDINAKQNVLSNFLEELKLKKGNSVMLIPIAGDNGISSLSMLMSMYNVSESELPVILIDEKIKISEIENLEEIEKYIT